MNTQVATIEYIEGRIQSILDRPGMHGGLHACEMLILHLLRVRGFILGRSREDDLIRTIWRSVCHEEDCGNTGLTDGIAFNVQPNEEGRRARTSLGESTRKEIQEHTIRAFTRVVHLALAAQGQPPGIAILAEEGV